MSDLGHFLAQNRKGDLCRKSKSDESQGLGSFEVVVLFIDRV
jgi:hypothetical protein